MPRKSVEPCLKSETSAKRLLFLIKEMNHPNIIRPHYFTEDDQFYAVRTYYDDYVSKQVNSVQRRMNYIEIS